MPSAKKTAIPQHKNKTTLRYIPGYYQDKRGKWRWTLVGDNNKVYGASHQGFETRALAVKNFNLQGKK